MYVAYNNPYRLLVRMVNMRVFMQGWEGTGWRSWLRHCAASRKVAGSFLDDVDSASDRNEHQEYFLVGKGGRCVSLTTFHFHVPIF